MISNQVFLDRRGVWSFWLGCVGVTIGVLLHIPMFWMARGSGFHLAGMPMDRGMIFGMYLIIAGVLAAGYGLLPSREAYRALVHSRIQMIPSENAPLNRAHWTLMLTLVVALVIDVMKPATLGFTIPGMIHEYQVTKAHASLVPFSALVGTAAGSILWGVLADFYGRKAAILLSAVVFIGTSICGAMPSLNWNIGMCFLMGFGAGGMLPVTYALLAEMMPSKHRGWSLVLVGGLGAVGGYFVASGFAATLEPIFSWRILWLMNLPTGLILLGLGRFIPESAKFLLARGRKSEALEVMKRFGSIQYRLVEDPTQIGASRAPVRKNMWTPELIGKTAALTITALTWGLINFGLLLWMPNDLVSKGYSMALSSRLLAESALIACPTVFFCTFIYWRWSTKWALTTFIGLTFLGLFWVMHLETHFGGSPVWPIGLLIVGSNGIVAILLPYTSESYPVKIRGRATGWVAMFTKGGGVLAQTLGITALVPPLGITAMAITVPTLLSIVLFLRYGTETRGLDLNDLE
jgi:putative MFS transporter